MNVPASKDYSPIVTSTRSFSPLFVFLGKRAAAVVWAFRLYAREVHDSLLCTKSSKICHARIPNATPTWGTHHFVLLHAPNVQDVKLAADGTRKLVSVLTSGEGIGKKVETVIIPMLR